MGRKGTQAEQPVQQIGAAEAAAQQEAALLGSPELAQALQGFGAGELSLQDALARAKDVKPDTSEVDSKISRVQSDYQKAIKSIPSGLMPGQRKQIEAQLKGQRDAALKPLQETKSQMTSRDVSGKFARALATDPLTAQRFAAEQMRSDPLLGAAFGQDGLAGQLAEQAGQGALQPEDVEAYGQASDEIARIAGQQEGELARVLAERGLGAAPSGAAVAGISGIQGNKFERLAQQQRGIAEQRRARQMQSQQQLANLASQFSGALGGRFGQGMASQQQRVGELAGAAGRAFGQKGAEQRQANIGFQQQEATRGPTAGEIMGKVGGSLLGGLTGGITGGLGQLGGKLFGG